MKYDELAQPKFNIWNNNNRTSRIFGRNWNGKQLDQVEKEYKGIFNNRMIAHSQGTIIYASKLRDDLETEEGRWNFNSQ